MHSKYRSLLSVVMIPVPNVFLPSYQDQICLTVDSNTATSTCSEALADDSCTKSKEGSKLPNPVNSNTNLASNNHRHSRLPMNKYTICHGTNPAWLVHVACHVIARPSSHLYIPTWRLL